MNLIKLSSGKLLLLLYMDSFVSEVGLDVATDILQIIYDNILNEIRKTRPPESEIGQWLAPDEDDYSFLAPKETSKFGKVIIIADKSTVNIEKFGTAYGDSMQIQFENLNIGEYNLVVNVLLDGTGGECESHVESLILLLNYGLDQIKKGILESLRNEFNGIVNDRWIFNLRKLKMYHKERNGKELVCKLTFVVIDEEKFRPGGEEYKKVKKEFKKVAKIH